MKFLLGILLFFSWFSNAQSHAYFLSEFTGNSSVLGNIRSMAYDDSGFLWVAGQASEVVWGMFTDRGAILQRSDGEDFHNIPVPDFGLSIEHISQIAVMDNGNFYLRCVSKDGIIFLVLDPETVKFELVIFPESINKKEPNFSNVFQYGGRNYILVKNKSHIVLYELKGTIAEKITVLEGSENLSVNLGADFIPYDKVFMVGFISQGVYFYNWNGTIVQNPAQLFFETNIRPLAWITGKWHFHGDEIFTLDYSPVLYRFSEEKEKIIKLFDFSSKIGWRDFWFWNDGKGRLLLALNKGADLEMYEITENGMELINTLDSQNISQKSIIYSEDVDQNVWIGNPGFNLSYYWFSPGDVKRYLLSMSMRSLYPLGENKILASTEFSGWYEIDLEKNTVKPYKTFKNKEEFPLNYTRNIIAASDSTSVWTNYRYGIAKVDLKTHQYERWEGLPVESLERWNDSTLVYGTMNLGLMAFNTITKTHKSLLKNDSLCILAIATTENRIFAATDKGLLIYDGQTETGRIYKTSKEAEDNYFSTILKKEDGSFLLGTKSGKVFHIDPQTKNFDLLYEDGLKAPVASLIFYGDKLSINTFSGIISLDLKTGKTERYSTLNGFSSNEMNRYSALATKNGLLIGTVNGLNYFQPEEISTFESTCKMLPLALTFFDENKRELITVRDRKKLKNRSKIVLPANNRFFQLNFGMGTCFSPGGANFKYRLDDNPWIQLTQGRHVRFESLAPGTYQLEVAAFYFSGKEIAESLKFQVVAKEFFLQTLGFKLLGFLFLLALISAYYFNRIRKIKKEQALRTSISSDLHDEVGGLLTGISMRAEIMETTELPEAMQKDFAKAMAISSKEAVQAMRDVVWSIDTRKDDWESLLFRLREYGNLLFEDINIDFTLESKGAIPKTLSQKSKQSVYLICKEALNNAAKHASTTKVGLECEFLRTQIKITITDNGTGIKTGEVSGQGLKNMRMRAEKIKAGFEIISSELGTRIILILK